MGIQLLWYDSYTPATRRFLGDLSSWVLPGSLWFRTKIHGGFDQCGFVIRQGPIFAWRWLDEYHMHHLLALDHLMGVRFEGRITDVALHPAGIQVGVQGYGISATKDRIYGYTSQGSYGVGDVVRGALGCSFCPDLDSSQDHLATNTLSVPSDWNFDEYPLDVITQLCARGDASGDAPYCFAVWEDRVPWYWKKATADVDWIVERSMIAPFGLALGRSDQDIWTKVKTRYTDPDIGGDTPAPEYTAPTGYVDGSNVWDHEPYAYDESGSSKADCLRSPGWTGWLELTHAAILCDRIVYRWSDQSEHCINIDVDIYAGGWTSVYSDVATTQNSRIRIDFDEETITAVRFRFEIDSSQETYLHEVEFGYVGSPTEIGAYSTAWATNITGPLGSMERQRVLSISNTAISGAEKARDLYLAERYLARLAVGLVLGPWVKDSRGVWFPSWCIRAGDVVDFTDLIPLETAFSGTGSSGVGRAFITATQWRDSGEMMLFPDVDPDRAEIFMEQLS